MPWRRLVIVLGVIGFLVTACARVSRISTGGTGSIGNAGIRGTLTIGPLCPVQSLSSPCPNKAIEGFVTVMDANGAKVLSTTRTSATGAFTVPLDPGTYRVYAREIGDNPRGSKPRDVTVRTGAFTTVDLVIDTGIR
jgi:hypothetical protein